MNLQDKNWENLFGHITTEGIAWHGIWTAYSPDKEIITSFKAVRRFQANEDQTVITHTNKYTYSDGREEEKIWHIEKQTCSQPDGVIYPVFLSMRAVSFGKDKNAWVSKKLEAGKKIAAELFFRYQDWRTSVAIIYAESGELERITIIREHLNSFPNTPAKAEIEKLPGKWSGRKEYLNSDLEISASAENQEFVLDPTKGKNKTISLPDGIVVNVPEKVNIGEEFEIVAGKLVAENEYKRLTAQYDKSGAFAMLISEVFSVEDEAEGKIKNPL
ncbi:DUF3598 family protein [Hassallia byssoidea VB512170]|uniref:DUF3598 family protein n=1 Tax=Hassallia byssoidea VB512170 TaxID=1304833 RepID=A0A846HK10_9CYAN|nr:DUF3598 family protein [Hassalia byssoidea]NEU77119.1 DUF3598 family protein [Hassalia byssoidea VB512170]